ncbi:MAG: tetratricopeptide repeat protein [Betaproteobacteria bacterium]|nr:tetratricopeptide repeat protein [Betaproteobacteria bacterium]
MSSFNFQRFLRSCLLALCLSAFLAHADDGFDEGLFDTCVPESFLDGASRNISDSIDAPLDAETYYDMLLGEMALTRRDLPLAATAYRDLARRMPVAEIIERAILIARITGDYEWGLELLALWQENDEPDPVRFALAKAEILLGAGRILEMEEPIAVILDSNPSQQESNFLRLMRLLERGSDTSSSYTLISRLAARYPDVAAAQFVLAVAANQADDKALAEEAVLRAHNLNPDWELPLLMRSDWMARDIANKSAEIDAHLAMLENFLKRHPDNTNIRMQLARLLILSGKEPSYARKHFDRLLVEHPDSPAVLYSAAMLAMQTNDMESARRLLNHILAMPVTGDMANFLLAQIEETAGNKELARQYYEKVSYGFSSYFAARIRLARMLMPDDLASARRVLAESETRTPDEQVGLRQVEAQLLCENEQYAECYEMLLAIIKEFPEHHSILYDAALAAEKLKRWNEVEQHLRRLISLQPENAEAYNALGYSFADRNVRLSEARALIEKALELSPNSPHIVDSMGWVLYRLGKLPEALAALEEAYARMKDPEVAAHLGEVLWQLGRHDEAKEIWQQAGEKSPDHPALKETKRRFMP